MRLIVKNEEPQAAQDQRLGAEADLAEFVPAEITRWTILNRHPSHCERQTADRIDCGGRSQDSDDACAEPRRRSRDGQTGTGERSSGPHSPPYWTLKEYRDSKGQMGHIDGYEDFLNELDKVWTHCFRALVPGGRLICVVGDVCLSRRKNNGRHTVVPLHASIQEHCRKLGFDNLAPIIWHKIANAAYEVENGSGFLGKPYEPNSVIKNDIEFILMERKPGGYRAPGVPTRVLSVISDENHKGWFQQIWTGLTGASTRHHPAPYPVELAERLIRMFSFVGDSVLDPFLGTGTTTVAAARSGRNSIGLEVDEHYFDLAHKRIANETSSLFSRTAITVRK